MTWDLLQIYIYIERERETYKQKIWGQQIWVLWSILRLKKHKKHFSKHAKFFRTRRKQYASAKMAVGIKSKVSNASMKQVLHTLILVSRGRIFCLAWSASHLAVSTTAASLSFSSLSSLLLSVRAAKLSTLRSSSLCLPAVNRFSFLSCLQIKRFW